MKILISILSFMLGVNALAAVCIADNSIAGNAEAKTSFKNDVMPVFMRGGCNGGACHGSARGKDGFKLSLFGYDPQGDYYRLLEEHFGRRINLAAPEKSLLLEKAAGQVSHTGGKIFETDSPHYKTLLKWINEGAHRDDDGAVEPIGLEIEPSKVTFKKKGEKLQAKVMARYSDGSSRDVSSLALYMTNNEAIARFDDQATIHGAQPGGTHVFARFDRFTVGTEVIVLPDGQFDWVAPPQMNYIDELVDDKLKELQILPSEICNDQQFLRRVMIDLNGKLPTAQEFESFMADQSKDKRSKLVDRLLSNPEVADVWAAQWGEWLRIKTDTNPEKGTAMKAGWNYYFWLHEQLLNNRPWDRLANELLTGSGSNFRDPPSNFYTMLPQGKLEPMKLGEDTAQVFLGLRTQCAQCHNHPFDRWTIDDYYSFTSFFTGVRRKHGTEAREYLTFVDVEAPPAKHLVDGRPMPHRFLGGDTADVKNKDPRKVLAGWMTASDNELFRRNLANRIWANFFGRGIIHPIDDVRVSNPASNEALLEKLGKKLAVDYKFDPKKLMRDICLSRTYQLSPAANASNSGDNARFSHAYLRRMRADVMFDCLHQALEVQPKFRRSTAQKAIAMFQGGSTDNHNSYFFSTFGQAKRESVCTCETKSDANLSQALHLINGKTINDTIKRNPILVPRLMEKHESSEEIVSALYVQILSRKPSDDELKKCLELAPEFLDKKASREYFDSLVWALLNSNEFMFNH